MPQEDYIWLPREELLTFEEITRLVERVHGPGRYARPPDRRRAAAAPRFAGAGANARGESADPDLALTTNGILLAENAAALRAAGLGPPYH